MLDGQRFGEARGRACLGLDSEVKLRRPGIGKIPSADFKLESGRPRPRNGENHSEVALAPVWNWNDSVGVDHELHKWTRIKALKAKPGAD